MVEKIIRMLSSLGQDVALALSLTLVYGFAQRYFRGFRKPLRQAMSGSLFGAAAVMGMALAGTAGLPRQLNSTMLFMALAASFSGSVGTLTAAGIAVGASAMSAQPAGHILSVLGGSTVGVFFAYLRSRFALPGRRFFLVLGVALALVHGLLGFVADSIAFRGLSSLPMLLLYPGAALLIAAMLRHEQQRDESHTALMSERERLLVTIQSIADAVIATDAEGRIELMNTQAERLTGYTGTASAGRNLVEVFQLIDAGSGEPQAFPLRQALTERLIAGASGRTALVVRNGAYVPIDYITSSITDLAGKIIGVVLVFRDISRRIETEEQLRSSLHEKEILIKEIHHRVKNNLQVVYSLLDHQTEYIEDEKARMVIAHSRDRIQSMAIIHEQLYQSRDLAKIEFSDYVLNLAGRLFDSYLGDGGQIQFKTEMEDTRFGVYTAIPCGLILNELISNSLKYAFPHGNGGTIEVSLKTVESGLLQMRVADDGVGLSEKMDLLNTQTLGLQLVSMLVQQLQGTIQVIQEKGTEFIIEFEPSKRKREQLRGKKHER